MTPPPDWFDADEAQQLLRHLEWQPEGFSLLFVFADALPAQWLADWLNAALRPAGLTLQQPTCAQQLADAPDAVVDALMAELGALAQAPGAVWLPLHHYPQHADWDAARRKLLARLNERRFLLERDLPRPLLLVLPANFRPITREIAPDIWHIRVLSQQWRTPALSAALAWCWQELKVASPMVPERMLIQPDSVEIANLLREWNLHKDKQDSEPFVFTGWQAGMALLSVGRLAEAKEILSIVLPPFLEAIYSNISMESSAYSGLSLKVLFSALESGVDCDREERVLEFCEKRLDSHKKEGFSQGGEVIIFDVSLALCLCQATDFTVDVERYFVLLKNIDLALESIEAPDLIHGHWVVFFWLNYAFGDFYFSLERMGLAAQAYQLALDQCFKGIIEPGVPFSVLDQNTALAYLGLADAHMGLQDWPAAEQALAKSVAIFRQLAAAPRAPRHAREDLAIALARQALLPPGDLAPLQEAERILLQLCAEFVEVPAYPRELDAIRELAHLLASSVAHSG